jgi:hypothetical protein
VKISINFLLIFHYICVKFVFIATTKRNGGSRLQGHWRLPLT